MHAADDEHQKLIGARDLMAQALDLLDACDAHLAAAQLAAAIDTVEGMLGTGAEAAG